MKKKKMEMKESGKENSAAHVSIHMDYTSHNKEEQSTSFLAFSPQILTLFASFLSQFKKKRRREKEERKKRERGTIKDTTTTSYNNSTKNKQRITREQRRR